MKPKAVKDLEMAFGSISGLMPDQSIIPQEFKNGRSKWCRVFEQWFYSGKLPETPVKDGIDRKEALRHIATIAKSWEPKHEHKESACAYLLSLWFEEPVKA